MYMEGLKRLINLQIYKEGIFDSGRKFGDRKFVQDRTV